MDELDDLVTAHLACRLAQPEALALALPHIEHAVVADRANAAEGRRQLRARLSAAESGIRKLLCMVEAGTIEADDPTLKERLGQLRAQVRLLTEELAAAEGSPTPSQPEQAPLARLAACLRHWLSTGPIPFRRAMLRRFISKIVVGTEAIEITLRT